MSRQLRGGGQSTGTFDDGLLYSNRRTPDQDAAALRYVLAHGAEDCLDAIFGLGDDE